MLPLDATQQAIVAAANKDEISWLFEVDKNGNGTVDYYWSTKIKTWSANNYVFKVLEFPGIEMNRAQGESGIQAPSGFEFTISNKDGTLSPSDFSDGNVTVRLVVKAGANEAEIRAWNFAIFGVGKAYQKLVFECEDWLQKYLKGDWPNTPLLQHLWPTDFHGPENACVPLILGRPCIPVRSLYTNLIANGDMEENSDWTPYGTPDTCEQSSEKAHDGTYSWKVEEDGTGGDVGVKSAVFTTITNRGYCLTLWVYPVGAGFQRIKVRIRKGDNSGWALDHWQESMTWDTWNKIQVNWKETAGGAGAYVTVTFGGVWTGPLTHTFYVDDASIMVGQYVLGPALTDPTDYDVYTIKTPAKWDGEHQVWSKNDWTFNYLNKQGADGNNYTCAEFLVEDLNGDGTPDANILFLQGKNYLDIPAYYERDDTKTKTNPGDVLDYLLQAFGVPSARIDATTLAAAKSTYTSWGLTWHVGLYFQEPRKDILARLCLMCHTELIVRDKIYFKVHSKTSQKTLDKSHITRPADQGEGSFVYNLLSLKEQKDSGYVTYQEQGECLDELIKSLVTVKGSANSISSETVSADYVQDSQNARRIGTLALQRAFLPFAKTPFTGKGTLLALECDDMVTLNHADYGGTYDVLIDHIRINKDLSMAMEATRFSQALDDWADLFSTAVQVEKIPATDGYQVVTAGPDRQDEWGNPTGNAIPGRLRLGTAGNYILFDPFESIQKFIVSGITMFNLGHLGSGIWGLEILDNAGNPIFKVDGTGSNVLCGGLLLDGVNKRILSDNYVSGPAGAGFSLDPDLLEVGNIACRGIFRTAVFQKDVISAVGGNVAVSKGTDVLASDMTAADSSTLTIEGNDTFAVGDILRIKDGIDDEWLEVTNIGAAPTYTVTRDKASQYAANNNPAWKKGAAVINYGQSGDGLIYMTASETNAPYLSVATHAGSPWSALTTRLRIGNLNGYLGITSDLYGLGVGSSSGTNANLIIDPTNGIRLRIGTTNKIVLANDGTVTIIGEGSGITSINGGNIQAATVTATQIKGTAFGTLTISSGKIVINTTDALEIGAAGNIKVLAGGDIIMTSSDTNPSMLNFDSKAYIGSGETSYRELCIWPNTSETGYFMVGWRYDGSFMPFQCIYEFADYIYLSTHGIAGGPGTRVDMRSTSMRLQINDASDAGWVALEDLGVKQWGFFPQPAIPGAYWYLGDATDFWMDVSYKTITDRGCLGVFDSGVEMPDGSIVSDLEALKYIQIDTRPGKVTVYGVPMFDYRTMPKAVYKPADRRGKLLPRDENDEPYLIDKKGEKRPSADGAEMSSLISIMIGAIKELDSKVEKKS